MKTPSHPPATLPSVPRLPTLSRRRTLGWLAAPALGAVLAGCATSPADERAALLERARAYWAAVQANDFVAAWPFEAISRDPHWTLQSYLKRVGGIMYREVQVLDVASIDGDRATVRVQQRFDVPLVRLTNQEATLSDTWRRIEGQWYHERSR